MTKPVHLYASQRVSRRAKDGSDGSSVTIISKSVTYQISASGTETPTGTWSENVVATTDTKPYLWTRTIVVYSDLNSTTSYSVSYRGKDGEPGKDAVNINLSPSELVYNADKDGNISSTQFNNNTSTVSATMGGKAVSCITSIVSKDNCEANIISSNDIKITKITTESVATGKYVPASAGGVKLKVTVDGTDYYSYLPFRVNTNTFVKTVLETDESFQRKYTEISNKYNTVSSELNKKADLKTVESTIEQTAKNIKLEVLSKTSGRRNMLVNSAFRNQDSVFIHSLAHIEKNTGVDGVNCIHSSDKYSGTGNGNYIGAFWDSTQKNGAVTNSPIRMGKKYVISCWIKSDNKALPFVIECFFMNSINQQNRGEDTVRKEYHVDNVNEWKRIDFVVDTTDTSEYASKVTPYLTVNIWSNTKNVPKATGATEYPTCHAYICQPMMEEGDKYGGWTLSEDDYEYVGGNILDNTRSLEKSGNLEKEESEIINEGYEYAYAVAHSNNTTSTSIEMLQWNVAGRINDGQDYMFSFLAKGTGMVSTYLRKDGTPRFFVESSNNKHNDVSSDGNVYFELTKEWKRYWVHYHLNTSSEHPLPEKLLIKCYGGNEVYICQPKLEIGATMTEFTERKTDLVDKASLKKAGIGITDREVLLYGEQVKVMNGNAIAALFKDGMLNADLIAAKVLESLGSNGARVSISDGIMEFFGSVNKTKPNIRFGLNSEGSAVLSYYDNNGDLLYDLGPDGISTMDKTNGSFTAYQFYTSQNLFGVSSTPYSYGTFKTFTSSHNPPSISETFLVADNSYDSHLFPSLNPSTNTKTTLYRYTAPRINGKIVADSLNGFTTQELASKADGKYFTSKAKADVVKNGNLASLAPDGDYWNVNAGVVNQGNFMPAVLKLGEYYDKPTYSRALPMSLIAGSKELGIVGKICSKETTRQWGQGIQA